MSEATPVPLSPLKQALRAIEDLEARLEAERSRRSEPVAIIGMSCRFPGGANTPEAYWELLHQGGDAVIEVPESRWDVDAIYDSDPDVPGKTNSRHGGFLQGVDVHAFDALFFRTSPREAASMDPQQRLLLEVAWEALERAGQPQEKLTQSLTGVYVGIGMNDYNQEQLRSGDLERIDPYTASGNFLCFAAGRISYLLGLQGPSLALDTACSSSLVAVHLACRSIRSGECHMAVAAGVQLMLSPEATVAMSRTRALAPDGRCKAFDARANGFVRGEGCGAVVLKRLSDAIADNDPVLAVIRGSAVNHDGPSAGLTVPNGPSQEAVIRRALEDARLSSGRVSYVEAHGTGTALGDPIEMSSLAGVFGAGRASGAPLMVGSVKTNLGHLEAASGMAGLIKVILALQHREVPPHLHLQSINPHIPLGSMPVTIPVVPTPWPDTAGTRVAGVSSFGASGTNAHVIVEEYAGSVEMPQTESRPEVFVLSGKTAASRDAMAAQVLRWLGGPGAAIPLRDICGTSTKRRSHHDWRVALPVRDKEQLVQGLGEFVAGRKPRGLFAGHVPSMPERVVFVFSGQGSQWSGAGRELFRTNAVFRQAVEECDAALRPTLGWSVSGLIDGPDDETRIQRTEVAQPLIFALQIALAALWRSYGIRPDAVVGHSMGEVAAACVAGALSLSDGARVIACRGESMKNAFGLGRMISVEAGEAQLASLLEPLKADVSVAAVNAADFVVLSGTVDGIERACGSLDARGMRYQRLPAPYAFHSHQMDVCARTFRESIGSLSWRKPAVAYWSTVTGRAMDSGFDADYWTRNVSETVRFAAAVEGLMATGHSVFLEIGPHPVLAAPLRSASISGAVSGAVLSSLRRGASDTEAVNTSLAELYARGAAVNWSAGGAAAFHTVVLPTSVWQKSEHRVGRSTAVLRASTGVALLGRRLESPALRGEVFESAVSLDSPAFLKDHVVQGHVILPAAAFVEMAIHAARDTGMAERSIEGFSIRQALTLDESTPATVQVVVLDAARPGARFEIYSRSGGSGAWQLHASGSFAATLPASLAVADLDSARRGCTEVISVDGYYSDLKSRGIDFGPSFRTVRKLWRGTGEALGEIRLKDAGRLADDPSGTILLDACLQVAGAALAGESRIFLPVACDRIRLEASLRSECWYSVCTLRDSGNDPDTRTVDVRIFDHNGAAAGLVEGLMLRVSNEPIRSKALATADWFVEMGWEPAEATPAPADVTGGWLILGPSDGGREDLVTELKSRGATVIARPAAEAGSAWDELVKRREPVRGIVLIAGSHAPDEPVSTAIRDEGVALLGLLQRAASEPRAVQARVWLVTRHAVGVMDERVDAAAAALWGLGRTAALEHPEVWGKLIDVEGTRGDATTLIREFGAADEVQVAFRQGQRWVGRIRQSVSLSADVAIIRNDATYLITGGLGSIGLKLARHLVERGARHLLLAGRTRPSDAVEVELQHLRERAEVVTVAVDAADESAVGRMLDSVRRRMPGIRGVFHLAGVLADGVLATMTWERVAAAVTPKADGAQVLDRMTRTLPLDCFVMFSSAASLLGSPGQSAYSAANAALDAIAHDRRSRGLPALSVNWGPWEDTGMVVEGGTVAARRWSAVGMSMLDADSALSALDRLMSARVAQTAVIPLDWSRYARQLPSAASRALVEKLSGQDVDSEPDQEGWDEALRRIEPHRRPEAMLDLVSHEVGRVVGLDRSALERQLSLSALGVDSLMAVDLRNAFRHRISVQVDVATLLGGITVESLAERLLNEWVLSGLTVPAVAGAAPQSLEEVEI